MPRIQKGQTVSDWGQFGSGGCVTSRVVLTVTSTVMVLGAMVVMLRERRMSCGAMRESWRGSWGNMKLVL